MNQFELILQGLPIRQPSPGYIDRILAERPARIEPSRLLRRRRIRFALPVTAAIVVLCLSAVFYWPSGEVDREVAKAPAPKAAEIDKDHFQFDAASPSPPAVSRDIQEDMVLPVPIMAERMFRFPAFSEGLAATEGPLAEGAAPVAKSCSSALGYMDITGRWVILPKFRQAEDFAHGIARVQDADGQPYYHIDRSGKRVADEVVRRLEPAPRVFPPKGHYDYANDFHGGLAAARSKVTGSGSNAGKVKWGYIDRTGKFVIPPRYDVANGFSEGLAVVHNSGKVGFIDATGKVVIPLKYRSAWGFSEGLAAVRLSVEEARAAGLPGAESGWTPWAYIDHSGKFVSPERFSEAQPFHDGLAYVSQRYVTAEAFRGFIDRTGAHVLDMRKPSEMKPADPNHMPIPKEF